MLREQELCQLQYPASSPDHSLQGLEGWHNTETHLQMPEFQLPGWGIKNFSPQDIPGSFLNWGLRQPLQIQGKHFKCNILKWAATRAGIRFPGSQVGTFYLRIFYDSKIYVYCVHIPAANFACADVFFSDFSVLIMSSQPFLLHIVSGNFTEHRGFCLCYSASEGVFHRIMKYYRISWDRRVIESAPGPA